MPHYHSEPYEKEPRQVPSLMAVVQKVIVIANILSAIAVGIEAFVRISSVIRGIHAENKKRNIGFTSKAEKAKIIKCPECNCEVVSKAFRYIKIFGKKMPIAYRGYCINCKKWVQIDNLDKKKSA